MFVLRQFFAGILVRAFTPPGLMAICSIFALIGLFWLSYAYTIQHLPQDVAQLVVVDGKYSPEAAAQLTDQTQIVALKEALRQGAAMTFRYVAVLPAILFFLFGAIYLVFQARGGYRPVKLDESR